LGVNHTTVRAMDDLAPVRIRAGTFENPYDMVVGPDQRLLLHKYSDPALAEQREVLTRAGDLINGHAIMRQVGGFVDYFQLQFDTRQLVFACGLPAETIAANTQMPPLQRSKFR